MTRRLLIPVLALAVAGVTAVMVVAATGGSTDTGNGATERQSASTTAMENMPGMDGMNGGMDGSGGSPPAIADLPETPILSPTRMGAMVMPPGMIVTADTTEEEMASMAAVDRSEISYEAPPSARGDRPLTPQVVDGVKVFELTASTIGWRILPDVQVAAYAFNQQVPGPRIRVTQGDRVRIVVRNDLPEPTSVHWHGLDVPNEMDGAGDVTQEPIAPGESYTYEYTVEQAGTFFYHSHQQADRQQALGLYGALIVDPAGPPEASYDREVVVELQEWKFEEGYTFPAMPEEGLLPNFFTINGKAYPATEQIDVKQGERVLFRFIGSNSGFVHPMHIHGGPFTVVATDGNPVPPGGQLQKDTISVAPGERYDVVWTARRPGKWLLHCHVLHHTTNDGVEEQGGGGLTMIINVT